MKKLKFTEHELVKLVEHISKKYLVDVEKQQLTEVINEKYKTWEMDFGGRKITKSFRQPMDENSTKMWCEKYFEKTPTSLRGVNESKDINENDIVSTSDARELVKKYYNDIDTIFKKSDDYFIRRYALKLMNNLTGKYELHDTKIYDSFIEENKDLLVESPEVLEPEVKPDVKPQVKPDEEPIRRMNPRKKPFTKPDHIEPDEEQHPKALIENKMKLSKKDLEDSGIDYNPDFKYYKKGDFIYKVGKDHNYTSYKDGKIFNLGKNFQKEVIGEGWKDYVLAGAMAMSPMVTQAGGDDLKTDKSNNSRKEFVINSNLKLVNRPDYFEVITNNPNIANKFHNEKEVSRNFSEIVNGVKQYVFLIDKSNKDYLINKLNLFQKQN
jgi:hypothetical protein